MVSNILSLKRFGNFFLDFTEEVVFRHFLFINVTKFRLFLFFCDHTNIKKWKPFKDMTPI